LGAPPSSPLAHRKAASAPEPVSATLKPYWLWILFAVIALSIPLIGFWFERR
jgi:hypothetical protein